MSSASLRDLIHGLSRCLTLGAGRRIGAFAGMAFLSAGIQRFASFASIDCDPGRRTVGA
jgi:hypothetical protein